MKIRLFIILNNYIPRNTTTERHSTLFVLYNYTRLNASYLYVVISILVVFYYNQSWRPYSY